MQGTCLASSCGIEGHVCGTGNCLNTLSEQHRQLAKLYGRLSISDKSEMELIANCHGLTEVNLITVLGFYSMMKLEGQLGVVEATLQTEQRIGGL